MPLTDQQLRQELLRYGEVVPPITQRNREDLRNRLEVLRSRPRSPVKTSPSRTRSATAATRSRPARGLIELSDSETDTSSNDHLSRPGMRGDIPIQTRSIAAKRASERSSPMPVSSVTVDVEESSENFRHSCIPKSVCFFFSVARHRREIQQLIDSARDRTRVANANISSGQYQSSRIAAPRPTSVSSRYPSTFRSDLKTSKRPLWIKRCEQTIQAFWLTNKHVMVRLVKALIAGILIAGGLIILKTKLPELFPQRKGKSSVFCFVFILFKWHFSFLKELLVLHKML